MTKATIPVKKMINFKLDMWDSINVNFYPIFLMFKYRG